MNLVTGNTGWIEVICGPMFSGKSEELIRRLRRAMIARKRVQVFKPALDDRYSLDEIVSHGELRMKSEVVQGAADILKCLDWRTEVVGIDEANFMGPELVGIATQLADSGKQVIISGLDTDYMGRPFAPIPDLLCLAESITKTLAICMRCGNPAKHTQRLRGLRRADRGGRDRHVRGALPPLFRAGRPPSRSSWSSPGRRPRARRQGPEIQPQSARLAALWRGSGKSL